MRWSPVKWEAVHDICSYDEKQTLSSYYFPNVRYHTRWKELEENDFISGEMAKHYELKGYYDMVCRDCELKQITDIVQYMDAVRQEDYTLLIAVKGDGMAFMDESVKEKFRQMGLFGDYTENSSYFAAVHEGKTEEGTSKEILVHHGSTGNRLADYEIRSAGWDSTYDVCASIKINNEEWARNGNGINMVIYSNARKQVVDSVSYDGEFKR